MTQILITGTNRGIGLELCRQLSQEGNAVIAVCRQASEALLALAQQEQGVTILQGIDLSHAQAANDLATALTKHYGDLKLDAVINNAGLLRRDALDNLDFNGIEAQMQVNAYGPLRVVQACLPRLSAGSRILMVTSRMGSIADNSSGGYYGYRMSKTALNAATVSLAHDLKEQGIAVGLVHPGFVRTEMTQGQGFIDPPESASSIIARLNELKLDNSGSFWHMNGEILPW